MRSISTDRSPPTPLHLQVNFLSHFALSHELLAAQRERRQRQRQRRSSGDKTSSSDRAPEGTRVVLLSSIAHYAGAVQWRDKQSVGSYDPFTSYGLSKLANTMTAFELQRRIDRSVGDAS
jgi:NAD(P)-dependent dehydrogenase (short-subunit alcohol dehydrogenase family)